MTQAAERTPETVPARVETEGGWELERLKGEFLNVAAHELRSPLAILKGYVAMLLEGSVPEAHVPKVFQLLALKADEMGRLITEMLEIARIEAAGLVLSVDDVQWLDVVDDALRAVAPRLDSGHTVVIDEPRVSVTLAGDRARLSTALTNLLDNALKYSPDGGDVEVTWVIDDDWLRVSVHDHGVGISPEQLPVLFTRFGRLVTPETSHIRGTGLGLYLAREIALRHGGDIVAASAPDQGSTFTMTLPVAETLVAAHPIHM